MEIKKLWTFPVPSTCLQNGIRFINKTANALILFDYYDENDKDKIYNGGILFNIVVAYKNTDEKFTKSLGGTYDTLVEYKNSEWLEELYKLNPEWAKIWDIRHFAIYFDSYGKYEIIAKDFKILEIKEGPLKD